jgi:hypothetical protein
VRFRRIDAGEFERIGEAAQRGTYRPVIRSDVATHP